MLRKAGLNAQPVLISTRDHGRIYYDYPFSYSFNYVVVQVELAGEKILCDATQSYCPDRLLPDFCLNDKGLLVDKIGNTWVELVPTENSPFSADYKISIPADSDSLHVDITYTFAGYKGMEMRSRYANDQQKLEDFLADKAYLFK